MNPALGGWLHDARRRKKCGTLSARQVDQLEQLGVVWEPIRSHWEKMFAALVEFCQTHGHCRVPVALPPDAKLGRWTHTQRVRRKQGKLDADRVSRLDALGFSWDVPVEQWETMFAALLAYKEAHGSFNVPLKWSVSPGAPRLGSWVISQRVAFWEGRLDPQRAERLAAIGFQWGSVPRSRSSGETSDPVPPVGRDKHVDGVTDFQSNEIALLPGMAGASLNP